MYTNNGQKTIFDDVKAGKIVSANIPEFNDIKTDKHFEIKKADLADLEKYNTTSFSEFHILHDNELFNLWGFDDVPLMSLNPEYEYKYPKFSTKELIKSEWQTEQGVPNRLNQFLRAEELNESIEDIKEQDEEYNNALRTIIEDIDKEAEKIKNTPYAKQYIDADGRELTEQELKKQNKSFDRDRDNKLKEIKEWKGKAKLVMGRYNPVKIKPAMKIDDITKKLQKTHQEAVC